MKTTQEWDQEYRAANIEFSELVLKIQEDARRELKIYLGQLCRELEQRTYPDYGDRKASYVSGNVCTVKTFNAAKALAEGP